MPQVKGSKAFDYMMCERLLTKQTHKNLINDNHFTSEQYRKLGIEISGNLKLVLMETLFLEKDQEPSPEILQNNAKLLLEKFTNINIGNRF